MQHLSSFGESWGLMPDGNALVFLTNEATEEEVKSSHLKIRSVSYQSTEICIRMLIM